MENSILIFILFLLLVLGIVTIAVIITLNQKDAIKKILEENSKNSNDINMRLIAFITETILSTDALTNRDVEEFKKDLEEVDHNKLQSIAEQVLNPITEPEKHFDPFEEFTDSPADIINENSSVINK